MNGSRSSNNSGPSLPPAPMVVSADTPISVSNLSRLDARKLRFACDSPLEGDGFEPPVPQQIRSRFRESDHFSHDGLTVSRPGTGSSNPSPSSRQSVSLPQPLSKVENPLSARVWAAG